MPGVMKVCSPADHAVVVAYLIAVGALGSSFYRSKRKPGEYFLGGRSIPWLAAADETDTAAGS